MEVNNTRTSERMNVCVETVKLFRTFTPPTWRYLLSTRRGARQLTRLEISIADNMFTRFGGSG